MGLNPCVQNGFTVYTVIFMLYMFACSEQSYSRDMYVRLRFCLLVAAAAAAHDDAYSSENNVYILELFGVLPFLWSCSLG